MSVQRLFVLFTVLALSSLCRADDPKKADPAKDDKQDVRSKAQPRPSAAATNFGKELNLPFSSLNTLGTRIEAARKDHDPVALAHAANELAVAEKVSGKKASLTSNKLLSESAELAKLRREVAELKAVARVNEQIARDDQTLQELNNAIADSEKRGKQETEAIKKGGGPEPLVHKVYVTNYTEHYAALFINGHYKMNLPPYESRWCVVEHRYTPTILTASGSDHSWGPCYIWGKYDRYNWALD